MTISPIAQIEETFETLKPEMTSSVEAFCRLLVEVIKAQQKQLETQTKQLESQSKQTASLESRLKELEGQLALNSRNSSKPPSTDGLKKIVKSLRPVGDKKIGGQSGHKGHQNKCLEEADVVIDHYPTNCPFCATNVGEESSTGYAPKQVWEIPEPKIHVTEHRFHDCACPGCGGTVSATVTEGLYNPVQWGPKMKGFATYLVNGQMLPLGRSSKLIRDIYGVAPSPGGIVGFQKEGHSNLVPFMEGLPTTLVKKNVLGFDETGMRADKTLHWVHVVSHGLFAYFMAGSRGADTMNDMGVLGSFKGTAMHDFWVSYLTYGCKQAYCNAHILRELIYVNETLKQDWAKSIIQLTLEIKLATEERKRRGEEPSPEEYAAWSAKYLEFVAVGLELNKDAPSGGKPLPLARRLDKHVDEILRFATDYEVPFDNNSSERDLRMNKVKQKVSGCFRSFEGLAYFASFRSFLLTAQKQGHHLLTALEEVFTQGSAFAVGLLTAGQATVTQTTE